MLRSQVRAESWAYILNYLNSGLGEPWAGQIRQWDFEASTRKDPKLTDDEVNLGAEELTGSEKCSCFNIYLKPGTGYAWAGHDKLNLEWTRTFSFLVSSLLNLGRDPPIGSKMLYSNKLPKMWYWKSLSCTWKG